MYGAVVEIEFVSNVEDFDDFADNLDELIGQIRNVASGYDIYAESVSIDLY